MSAQQPENHASPPKLRRLRLSQIELPAEPDERPEQRHRFQDSLPTAEAIMALAVMRPPVVVPTSEHGRFKAIGNMTTFVWRRHVAVLQGDVDPSVWVVVLPEGAANPKIFHAVENFLAPVLLDQLTHAAGRDAKRALRKTKLDGVLIESAPADRRLKPLFRR